MRKWEICMGWNKGKKGGVGRHDYVILYHMYVLFCPMANNLEWLYSGIFILILNNNNLDCLRNSLLCTHILLYFY